MSLDHEKLADLFDAMGSLFARAAHESRQTAPAEPEAPALAPAPKTRKPKAAAEPMPAPVAAPDFESMELTIDDMRTALKGLMETHGKEVMANALKAVGAGRLADVDPSQYQELITLIFQAQAAPASIVSAKPSGPAFSEVTAVFKQLIEKDKNKAMAVLSAFDVKKVSALPEDKWQEAIDTVIGVLAEPDEEDDLL